MSDEPVSMIPRLLVGAEVRSSILRTVFPNDVPDEDLHRGIVAWCGAASPNTLRAFRSDLRIIEAFQRACERPSLPLAPAHLFMLIEERARLGMAKSSITRLVATAVRLHDLANLRSPVDATVKWKLKELRRSDNRIVRQARGMRIKGEVGDIRSDRPEPLSLLSLLASVPEDLSGLRDRALLSSAYDAGLRRSEVVRTRVEHLTFLPNGEASLFIPRSKTDQEGEGARVWLSSRSVAHIKAWREAFEIDDGFLFRSLSNRASRRGHLGEEAVSRILKKRLRDHLASAADEGAVDSSEIEALVASFSAHSLRVGCDQDLMAAGVDIGTIMLGLRWKSPRQPLAYARHLAPATTKLAATLREVTA